MLVGKVSLAILWSATMALASPSRRGNHKGATGKRSSFGSGRYLVKLSTQTDMKGSNVPVEQHRQACNDQIKKLSSDLVGAAKVHNTFNFDQHCSMSVEALEGFSPRHLADYPGVTGVDVIKVVGHGHGMSFPVPPPVSMPQPKVESPRYNNHHYLPPPPSAYRNNSFAPHVESEVHLMHNLGLLGDSNVSVCLVDSGGSEANGVDYTNWRLGGDFGKGCKIAMGHDFVGNDGKHPGPSPYTNCTDHGTHVTGIVGANFDYDFKFSGAAPEVTLGHYRAFACTGQSSEDTIAAALLRAYADGCKVITLSLGGPSAWEDGLIADAASHVTNQGSLVVSSAGNFGTQGLFYGDVPGELTKVLGTAATDLREYPVGYLLDIAHPSYRPIPYFAVDPVNINETLDVCYIPPSITDDPKCNLSTIALPNGDLKNSLLVLELGQCPHSLVAKWAVANKLRVAMVSFKPEDAQSPLNYYSNHFARGIHYFLIVHPSWVKALIRYCTASRGKLQVSFAAGKRAPVEALANHESGGNMAFYSSYGPTTTLEGFGKTLAAPGSNILSTLTVAQGGVGVMSGTSMACPLAAGIAALLFSHRKADNLTPRQVKSLMATTAQPVRIRQEPKDAFATVVQQGAGIVSAYRAYIAKTLIEPHSIALGDLEHFNNSHTITLKNTNKFAVTYTFSSTSSQTVTTYDKVSRGRKFACAGPQDIASIDINPSGIPRPGIAGAATVAFTPRSLTIPPGQSGTFTATFTFPKFSKKDLVRVPVVSGWLVIDSAEDPVPTYRIAYAGVATGLQVMPVLDSTDIASQLYGIKGLRHPFIMVGNSLDPDALPSTAADVLSDPNKVTTVSRKDGIFAFVRLAMPSRYLQADLVDANTTFIPTIPSNNNLHLAENSSLTGGLQKRPHNPPLFAFVPILGTAATANDLTRDPTDFSQTSGADTSFFNFNGMVAVKHPDDPATTSVDKGRPYRILIRALRLDSDPKLSASYDSWLSPPFQFLD
ncbi:BZ3500_MvSof-1268-A1-R1_Chr1-2g01387 [Microbotryum saponariae]|uniref:BZ3500_MvSof-1268-A1-R1_Chr1-2g01387 protein n=1 Tax=Microbotryum saponariae TaxID=289078 RepID=A0A2X0MIF5_9BASI|nr:BZ3500_MvSof-1268-A1-R1_Chr1-2g01387 [Microbotryum saponariae]SCZ97278.1 BZ3501_MvSof-1269-A2-R1_Chr1-2g00986 [Microbotryum saponariae]